MLLLRCDRLQGGTVGADKRLAAEAIRVSRLSHTLVPTLSWFAMTLALSATGRDGREWRPPPGTPGPCVCTLGPVDIQMDIPEAELEAVRERVRCRDSATAPDIHRCMTHRGAGMKEVSKANNNFLNGTSFAPYIRGGGGREDLALRVES